MKNKYCTKCKTNKPTKFFSKNKSSKDGFQYWCKDCVIEDSRTINGVIRKIYSKQRESCRHRNHNLPAYSRKELISWVSTQPLFFVLYQKWVESGYKKDLVPSIDRKDDYESYTLDNVQIMTWRDNRNKSYVSKKTLSSRKKLGIAKKVTYQFSLDGLLIKEYSSTYSAGQANGINYKNIGACCRNKLFSAGGFLWSYKKECPYLTSKQIARVKSTTVKKVGKFKNGILLSVFSSASEASKKTNIPQQSISANCRGLMKQAGGFVWKFI